MAKTRDDADSRDNDLNFQPVSKMKLGRKISALSAVGLLLASCQSVNQNSGRVLTSIRVTPTAADASTYPNGQVMFTATGQFNIPPLTGPITFVSPYNGEFVVANPSNQAIANIVSTGTGTVTVQCISGVSASVDVVATASANNGTATTVTAQAQLTCP